MINAVLFDLDGTLFDRDATVAGILAWQVSAFAEVIGPDRTAAVRAHVVDARA